MACTVDKVIKIAEAEVGYLEKKTNSNLSSKTANAGYNNYTKYAHEFDTKYPNFYNGKKNGYSWCDVFVDWLFVKAFGVDNALVLLGQPLKSYGAGCTWSSRYFKQIGRFYTTPKVGDQIFFKDSSGDPCHTGIVYKVTTTKVYTIEGNTSSASGVVANGGAVAKKSYSRSYSRIYGYGRPKYDAEKQSVESVVNKVTSTVSGKKAIIKKGQQHAIQFTGVEIEVDGICGSETNRMKARVLQHAMNLDYSKTIVEDGIFGAKSKAKLGSHYVKKGETQAMVCAAEILMELNGIDPNGVEMPRGIYGNGLVKAAKNFFKDDGTKITASEFLKLIQ